MKKQDGMRTWELVPATALAMALAMALVMTFSGWAEERGADAGKPKTEAQTPEGQNINEPEHIVLWPGGTRIPQIDVTPKGTLLAFAQKGGGDYHPNHVEMRRSVDGGKTWSKAKDFLADWKVSICYANPCSIVDRDTGTIWCFWAIFELRSKDQGGMKSLGVHYTRSDDDGLTWSEVKPLVLDGNQVEGYPTPSCGIQLSTGRLLLPLTMRHSIGKGNVPRTVYSDDHGKTWQFGKELDSFDYWKHVGSLEYTLLELADGRVYMNHRNNMRQERYRVVAFSEDGGISWSAPQRAADLIQPKGNGCHSGLARLTHPKTDDKSRVLFSAPWGWGKEDFGRENLAILISYDECQTWKPLKMLQRGNTSYSNLVVLPDKSIGCIYEFNDLSEGRKIWQQVRFIRFTLEWLTDGKDKVVPKSQPKTTP